MGVMINVDPSAARRPGLPVPARRERRVETSAQTGGPGGDGSPREPRTAPAPRSRLTHAAPAAQPEASIAAAVSRAGVSIQAEPAHARRGLRADASERARYRAAYESAGRPAAPRPTVVRSA